MDYPDVLFLAEAICAAKRTPGDNQSVFYCHILHGEIHTGDTVQIWDVSHHCILELVIGAIGRDNAFYGKAGKDTFPDNLVFLSSPCSGEYPLENASYLIKINDTGDRRKAASAIGKALRAHPTNFRETAPAQPLRDIENPFDPVQRREKAENSAVSFRLYVLGDMHIKREHIVAWLRNMARFLPDEVDGSALEPPTPTWRYSLDEIYGNTAPENPPYCVQAIRQAVEDSLAEGEFHLHLAGISADGVRCGGYIDYRRHRTEMSVNLSLADYRQNCKEILRRFEALFIRFGGMFGYIVKLFDETCQNAQYKDELDRYALPADGVVFLPKKPWDVSRPIDPHCMPGHADHWIGGVGFQACYGMWFGPAYYEIFPEEKVAGFKDCAENIALGNGFRRIFLYDDIMDCNAVENRRRQWSFRKHLDMCETIRKLNLGPLPPAEAYATGRDPYSEIFTEGSPFPHGGDRYAKVYTDNNGKTCPKSKAAGYMYVEYKDNAVIFKEKVPFDEQA